MKYLGALVICVLLVGLTASAFAELKSAEVNGSVRVRGVWVRSPGFDNDNNDLDVVEQRTRLGVEATFTEDVSAFIEFQMSNTWGSGSSVERAEDLEWLEGTAAVHEALDEGMSVDDIAAMMDDYGYGDVDIEDDEGRVILYQAYILANDMFDYPVSLKVGRQELVYGTELLLGDRDFTQAGLSFDAVKLMYAENDIAVDLFWAKLVERFNGESDFDDDLYGIYSTYEGVEDMVIDAYVLLLRRARRGITMTDTNNQYTVGTRVAGVCPGVTGISYNAEVAAQFGEDGMGDDYEGWLVDLLLAYAIEADYDPTVFAGYTFSTGDGKPGQGDHEAFMFPYTDNHARWGYADMVGLGNLNVIKIGASVCPTDKLTVIAQGLWFLAHQDEDAQVLFGRAIPSNSNDDNVAQEVDVSLVYNYTEDLQFELTYGHVFTDDWIEDSLPEEDDIDLVYAQAVVSF